MMITESKMCNRCMKSQALAAFQVRTASIDGLQSWCRTCISDANKLHYEAHKDQRAQRHAVYRKAHPEIGRAAVRKWRANHPEEYRASIAKSFESRKAISTKWVAANREKARAFGRASYMKHKERLRCERRAKPERNRLMSLKWRTANPEKWVAAGHRRRARVHGLEGAFTGDEWKALKNFYGNVCLACGLSKPLTADHVIPVIAGGRNSIDNIQPLCKSCNSSKHTKMTDYRKKAA